FPARREFCRECFTDRHATIRFRKQLYAAAATACGHFLCLDSSGSRRESQGVFFLTSRDFRSAAGNPRARPNFTPMAPLVFGSTRFVLSSTDYTLNLTTSRSKARCWISVGLARISIGGALPHLTMLRVSVARSASNVRKL